MKSTTIGKCSILVGAFSISFFLHGCIRLSSVLFPESLTYYDVDRYQASFPYVLASVTANLVGPLIGYLEQIFTMQRVIMAGCVLSTLSITTCYFSTSILTVTILWGVVFGSCFGLASQMIPVILNSHFPEDKSKANNIFISGSSLGGFVMPVVFQAINSNYGMSGAFLLLGAIAAHSIPAGILVNYFNRCKSLQNTKKLEETANLDQTAPTIYIIDCETEKKLPVNNSEIIPIKLPEAKLENITGMNNEQINGCKNFQNTKKLEGTLITNQSSRRIHLNNCETEKTLPENNFVTVPNMSAEPKIINITTNNNEHVNRNRALQNINKLEGTKDKNTGAIDVIYYETERNFSENKYKNIPKKVPELKVENVTTINNNQVTNESCKFSNKTINSNQTADKINKEVHLPKRANFSLKTFKILIDPVYMIILVINALSCWVLLCVWTIILDVVRDKGVEEKYQIYFVICIPGAELIARFICGYIIDKLSWKSSTTTSLSSIVMAFTLIIFNFVSSYVLIFIVEIIMSFFLAIILADTIALVHEFVEEKNIVMAMSCRYVLFGPSMLTLSPIIGYFRGNFGSYDYVIYIMSAVSFFCACIATTLPYLSRRKNRK